MSTEHRESDLIRSWLDETYEAERSPRHYLDHLLDEVPATPQQRRRPWRLPRWRRARVVLTPADTTQYQPDPIPATNGHTPTVIGRTTSMLSPVKAITAGALIFAIGGAFLIAQPFGQQDSLPAAEVDEAATEASAPVIVSGWSRPRGDVTQVGTEAEVDGVIQSRGFVREGDLVMDDPRLSGSVTITWNTDLYTAGDAGVALIAVSRRIENEEGSWSGSCTSLAYVPPSEDSPYIESCLLTGAGAYDGLSAYLTQVTTDTPNAPVDGLIFAGDPPPIPEMPSAE